MHPSLTLLPSRSLFKRQAKAPARAPALLGIVLWGFVLWGLAAASLTFWTLRLIYLPSTSFPSTSLPSVDSHQHADLATAQVTAGTQINRLAQHLGAAATKDSEQAPNALDTSRFTLLGIVAMGGKLGSALIAVEGKNPKPYAVGSQLEEKLYLQAVDKRSVTLSYEGKLHTLALPAQSPLAEAPNAMGNTPAVSSPQASALLPHRMDAVPNKFDGSHGGTPKETPTVQVNGEPRHHQDSGKR